LDEVNVNGRRSDGRRGSDDPRDIGRLLERNNYYWTIHHYSLLSIHAGALGLRRPLVLSSLDWHTNAGRRRDDQERALLIPQHT